jgi:hypothetical protein
MWGLDRRTWWRLIARWPRYDAKGRQVMEFGESVVARLESNTVKLGAYDAALGKLEADKQTPLLDCQ